MFWSHNRFDGDHREECQDCYENYLDFLDEQFEESRMDALATVET